MNPFSKFLSSALTAGMIVGSIGCGGGSDAEAIVDTRQTAPAPTGYAIGSEELAVFDLLNSERSRCGFDTFSQSTALDAAARGHADYQIVNNLFSHVQDPVAHPLGFTGARAADRATAAGYAGAGEVADETVRYSGASSKEGLGSRGVRDLLSAPYHLRGLMGGYRDVGVSVRSGADIGIGSRLVYLQINAAHTIAAGPRLLPQGQLATYPCEGTTGVNRQLRNETPSPVPGRNLAVEPLGGVVYFAVREGSEVVINTSSMTEVDTGRNVALREPVTALNDPHGGCRRGCFLPHEGYVAADAPLAANTRYRVELSGSNNGIAFTRTFTFMTGAGG